MDGPYRLTTRKTSKDRILGHWYYRYSKGELELKILTTGGFAKKSFASHKRAEYWSDKNKLKPHQVCLGSDKKIWFDCGKCHHEFVSRVANINCGGNWCPYCKNKKLCGDIFTEEGSISDDT